MATLQQLADEISEVLQVPVTIEDRALRLLAFAAHPEGVDAVRRETILGRRASASTRAWFDSFGIGRAEAPVWIPGRDEPPVSPRLCLPVRAGRVVLGYVWAIADAPVTEHLMPPGDPRLVAAQGLAGQAGVLLAREARAGETVTRLVGELLTGSVGDAARAADRLVATTGLPRGRVRVAVADVAGAQRSPEALVMAGVLPRRSAVAVQGDRVVMVVPEGAEGVLHRAADWLGGPAALAMGVGGAVPDPTMAARSLEQAETALRAATGSGVWRWDRLGLRRLIEQPWSGELVEAVRTPGTSALLRPEHRELARTALVYLDAAGSVARAAEQLGLHRQGVYYRLAQVERVTGLDLRVGQDRLQLHLLLTLERP